MYRILCCSKCLPRTKCYFFFFFLFFFHPLKCFYFCTDSLFSTDDGPPPLNTTTSTCGTLVASASGDVNVTVKMKQMEPGTSPAQPKLDIEMMVGAVHVLLCPKELHQLIELITDISDKSECVVSGCGCGVCRVN